MKRTRDEYGGFLPLELHETTEYYEFNNDQMQRFNSAKNAVSALLNTLQLKKIYAPYYMCPNVCKMLESHGVEVEYYFINEHLVPPMLSDEEGVCIYVADYFGIMDNAVDMYVSSYKYATIIIDNCHSFYHRPIFAQNVYNIYSCKKFFGVPDGAYLIGEVLNGIEMEPTYSGEYASYLLKCLERGTNSCYKEKKDVDLLLAQNYGGMSVLAQSILKSINYDFVKKRRYRNFELYQEAFLGINRICAEESSIPYMYPLNFKKDIKKSLIEEKIYVPTLWQTTLNDNFKGLLEFDLSKETIFLPVDQRYSEEDVQFIISVVKKYID